MSFNGIILKETGLFTDFDEINHSFLYEMNKSSRKKVSLCLKTNQNIKR